MVAIALIITIAGAHARGGPSRAPARSDPTADIFKSLGLEGLTLDMFAGEEGDTVSRTFSNSPGNTQTVSVSRSPGGSVSVRTSRQWSSLDGFHDAPADLRPSQMDFSGLPSVFQTGGSTHVTQRVVGGAKIEDVIDQPVAVDGEDEDVTFSESFKESVDSVGKSVGERATSDVTAASAPISKRNSKVEKTKNKKSGETKRSKSASALVLTPSKTVVEEPVEDVSSLPALEVGEPLSVTARTGQNDKRIAGVPTLSAFPTPVSVAANGGRKSGVLTSSAPKPKRAVIDVTPTRSSGERDIFGPVEVDIEERTRASSLTGPEQDFKESRVSKGGVTARVVSGSRVTPSSKSATVEACSDTEVSTEAVERCINAVRQNPSKYAKLLPCDIPVYTPRAPLATSSHLSLAAAAHASDMASIKSVTHTGSDGSTMGHRIWDRAGFVGSPIAENVAGGQKSARAVVFGWMCSEGHRKNIMSCKHDSMGTGLTRNGWVYWAQTFGCTKYNKCVC